MKFLEAVKQISAGKIMRRNNWLSPAGVNLGSNLLYVKMDQETGRISVFTMENFILKSDLLLTRANIESDDWQELTKDEQYQIELKELKRKYGKN